MRRKPGTNRESCGRNFPRLVHEVSSNSDWFVVTTVIFCPWFWLARLITPDEVLRRYSVENRFVCLFLCFKAHWPCREKRNFIHVYYVGARKVGLPQILSMLSLLLEVDFCFVCLFVCLFFVSLHFSEANVLGLLFLFTVLIGMLVISLR